jgi:hypothetical protein
MSVITSTMRGIGLGLGAVALAACGTADAEGDGGLPAYQPSAAPSPTGDEEIGGAGAWPANEAPLITDPPATVPADADRYLTKVSLRTGDVKHLGLRVEPDQDATSLEWPTVFLCEKHEYPSELKRVARYQVTIVPRVERQHDGKDYDFADPTLESAVTRYDSTASAEQALAEWRESVANRKTCEPDAFASLVPDLSLGDIVERRDDSLPVADNSAWSVQIFRKGRGEVARVVSVLQRHDDLLLEVIYQAGNVHSYDDVKQLATVLADRVLENPG